MTGWDDVRTFERTFEGRTGTWRDLGRAVGTIDIGARRIDLPPGTRATPPHAHAAEEEIFWVLEGAGTVWLDGATAAIAAGDAIAFRAGDRPHTVIAGDDGMAVLAFGERRTAELCHLPRAEMGWLGTRWVDVAADRTPFTRDEAAGPLAVPAHGPRPGNVVAHADVAPAEHRGAGIAAAIRDLGSATGARTTTLRHVTVAPGASDGPPRCHAAEELLLVVLDGAGTLRRGDDEHPLAAGSIAALPPGSGRAHALAAGPTGLVALVYSTRRPHDIVWFPLDGTLVIPGLGIRGRLVDVSP